MVQLFMKNILLFILALPLSSIAADAFFDKATLGERNIDLFWAGQFPEIKQDTNSGKLYFTDDRIEDNRFYQKGFDQAPDYITFIKSELDAGMTCPNRLLGEHFDYIRYGYRLMALSLLIEDYWHLEALAHQFKWKNSCSTNLSNILEKCRPQSKDMKNVVGLWRRHLSKNPEKFHLDYSFSNWQKERSTKKLLSHYRSDDLCLKNSRFCSSDEEGFKFMCEDDAKNIELLCSEQDQIYGVGNVPQIFYLISQTNFINTFNKEGMAYGCLRRFSQLMGNHEGKMTSLKVLSLALPGHLSELYGNRFSQGRPFIYGSLKEFANKGLSEIFQETTPIKSVESVITLVPAIDKKEPQIKVQTSTPIIAAVPVPKKEIVAVKTPMKSAFLQAAEVRESQNLERVEVDMLKLKYDYVFSLNMIQKLSKTLKTYMGREALVEMSTYDKLGTKEGPVPLLFIKFMLDMQEHQGLYNLISILGDTFYVSNEIDGSFKPKAELVQIKNDDSSGRQWQLLILRP